MYVYLRMNNMNLENGLNGPLVRFDQFLKPIESKTGKINELVN